MGHSQWMSCFCTNVLFYNKQLNCEYFSIFLPSIGKTTITQWAQLAGQGQASVWCLFRNLRAVHIRPSDFWGSGCLESRLSSQIIGTTWRYLKMHVLKFVSFMYWRYVMYRTFWQCRSHAPWFQAFTAMHIRIGHCVMSGGKNSLSFWASCQSHVHTS